MLKLDLAGAERFVSGHPGAFWEGWELVLFKSNPAGFSRKDGMFRGEWGVAKRISPNEQGRYVFRV